MVAPSFGILGPLELRLDGEAVDIGPMQLRRLLSILLLAPGRPVPLDTMVECMWPEDGPAATQPDNQVKTLRIYISRLRKVVPADIGPFFDVRGFRLHVEPEDVDAVQFEVLLAGSPQPVSASPRRSASKLRAALALWRGPALADCRDELWAIGAAARLDELRLAAIERLTDARLELGEHVLLCPELEHLVREHPLRERFWGQLILALYRSGRQADALRAFQRIRRRLGEELGIEPNRELAELEAAVLNQDALLDVPRRVEELGSVSDGDADGDEASDGGETAVSDSRRSVGGPATTRPGPFGRVRARPLTSFVGREQEMADITALIESRRLVTLTGPGGVGKTRLASELLRQLCDQTGNDSIFFADLATLREGDDVFSFVALVLGVKVGQTDSVLDVLSRAIGDETLLLLLDNCEHVAAACASLCTVLLPVCRGVGVLATSIRPLGVEGEAIYAVPSLPVPAAGTVDALSVAAEASVRLFVERASAVQRSFRLDESNAPNVATICRRLDGIPLALELAAARLRVLSTVEICSGLDERFRLLSAASSDQLPHHRTLEALIDWAYELLDADARWLLRATGSLLRELRSGQRVRRRQPLGRRPLGSPRRNLIARGQEPRRRRHVRRDSQVPPARDDPSRLAWQAPRGGKRTGSRRVTGQSR
jgi:DNA-binding SARP family transcriptional activator